MNKAFNKVAVGAALRAGAFVKKKVGRIRGVRYKGEINVVTDVDNKSESIIVGAIRRAFPDHDILAEERKYTESDSEFLWIVDPLDGTTNFLHGFPFFCVSIALARGGKMVLGVVYDPVRDELFHATKGKGAFLNRERIRVSRIRDIEKALLATGFAYNVKRTRNNNIKNFINFLKASQAVRRAGSAALDLAYVAAGRFDGFWELFLHPWDTAAAALIVEEAGGKVTTFDGSAYSIYGRETLASNSKIHSRMIKILRD